MKLHELAPAKGAKKKRKRVGRGPGTGHGKTATKGHKGLLARSGGGKQAGFEGGQMPLIRRVPKYGVTQPIKILGNGERNKPIVVQAHKFSKSAEAKIQAAGGSIEVIPGV